MTTRAKKGGAGGAGTGGTGTGGTGKKRGPGDDEKHPIQQGIEKLYAAGKTPRIRLDARRSDVVVPEHVRDRWKDSLVIDLDPGYPLNLVYADDALHVDLAFAGHVSRCTFTWQSIYGLFDRASGQGVQIASHLPKAELPEALQAKSTVPPPKLRSLSSVKAERPPETKARPVDLSDEVAKARRAKFRVINGG